MLDGSAGHPRGAVHAGSVLRHGLFVAGRRVQLSVGHGAGAFAAADHPAAAGKRMCGARRDRRSALLFERLDE